MKFKKYLLVLFMLLLSACGEKVIGPAQSVLDLTLTPMANEEAELMAYQMTGELVAPVGIYQRIEKDLELIRNTYMDSISQVNIEYVPHTPPSLLYVRFDSETFDSVVAGNYHYWDDLNNLLRVESIDISTSNRTVILHFEGRLNSVALVEKYAGIEGAESVLTLRGNGQEPTVFALKNKTQIDYFFMEYRETCPGGCNLLDFYYFTVENNQAVFHGSYLFTHGYDDSYVPEWAGTALDAYNNYRQDGTWRKPF